MPCFGNSEDRRQPVLRIKCQFPPDPEQYLPRLTEHKVQNEPDDVIDDPSSVFFDPNEKAGFVYTHVPSIKFDYAKQLVLTLPESKQEKLSIATTKRDNEEHERKLSVCSDFADSLDQSSSLRGSPVHESGVLSGGPNEHFKPLSRQDSLEFDPIVDSSICQVTLNKQEYCRTPATNKLPAGLSEDDVRTLYKTSHEPFFIDDFNDMHMYEENILTDITKSNGNNKGYISDAESVKTYQDSGIYDDDIIVESPSRLNHQQYSKDEMFGNDDDDHDMQMEKYSAFKTPMSSRHNSLEYLPVDSPLKSIIKHPRKIETRETRARSADRARSTDGKPSSEDSLDTELKETFIDLEQAEKRKKGDKYSHIQAKVQCFRSKKDKSPSGGTPARNKTPEPKPPGKKSELKRSQSRVGAKPKVDSLSNVKYTPGGGTAKVFKEKLKFRENAQPRTDTHGIEMYSHLPKEFQEIARRLARQDSVLKDQKPGSESRGRSLSRTMSNAGSRPGSRHSSLSPGTKRGRSCTKKSKLTPGNSISNIPMVSKTEQLDTPSKRSNLSRSSSIRSVPSTPKIHERHPSSSKITRKPTSSSRSPSAGDKTKEATPTAKKKAVPKSKSPPKRKAPPVTKDDTTKSTKEEKTTTPKTSIPKLSDKSSKTLKTKQNNAKGGKNGPKSTSNTPQPISVPKPITSSTVKELKDGLTPLLVNAKSSGKEDTQFDVLNTLASFDRFSTRNRPLTLTEDTKSNPLASLTQYITEHELMDTPDPKDISLMKTGCLDDLLDPSKLRANVKNKTSLRQVEKVRVCGMHP